MSYEKATALVKFLNNQTTANIAHYFKSFNIKGIPNKIGSCPFSNFLKTQGLNGFVKNGIITFIGVGEFSLGESSLNFLFNFNRYKYPNLIIASIPTLALPEKKNGTR